MSEIRDVTDTSFWVAQYRALETERADALFRDPYAKMLVGDRGPRIVADMAAISKYTQWSVVMRTVTIDRLIERAIDEGFDCIVNLGAGLDARPYRLSLPGSLRWIEVDYPHILEHKRVVLRDVKPRCRLERVACDLARDDERRRFLDTLDAQKVLILTEGVIPYLTEEQVGTLADDLAARPRVQAWLAEYFHPSVYRHLQNSTRTLKMQRAPFVFYPPDWLGFFKRHGWAERETVYAGELAREFGRPGPRPWWVRLIWPIVPRAQKELSTRVYGFTWFTRA